MIGAQHNTKHKNSVTERRHAVLEYPKDSQSLRRARRKSSQNHLSGGKWVRLQEHKRSAARLANKRESKSLILLLELIQRSRTHAAHTSGKTLLALQVWNFCAEGAEIMRAAGCKPLKREPSEAGLVWAWQKYFFATLKQRDGAPSRCFSDGANHVWLQRRDLVFREASVICRHQVDAGAGFLRQHQGVVHDLHADLARVDQLSQR